MSAIAILNVSSYVHLLSKHGCKILVEFLEVHWHSVSSSWQPIAGRFSTMHSSFATVSNILQLRNGIRTPHAGIWANASLVASAFAVKQKRLTRRSKVKPRCKGCSIMVKMVLKI
jgi:hypothetical protein